MKSWGIYIAIALGVFLLRTSWDADRDSSGAIVESGHIDAFKVRVGDCFNDSPAATSEEAYEVQSLAGVPCADPHDNEVFAVFDLTSESFPGSEVADLAFDSCLDRFEAFVGRDYETSQLDIVSMYPTQESWNRQNDREVVCAVYDLDLSKLTGSVKGQGL
jgi:Septum formation